MPVIASAETYEDIVLFDNPLAYEIPLIDYYIIIIIYNIFIDYIYL